MLIIFFVDACLAPVAAVTRAKPLVEIGRSRKYGATTMGNVIRQEVVLEASPKRIYETLLDARQFSEFTGGAPAAIASEAGGAFSCFNGMITGRNVELIPNQRIVQAWRAGNWPEGVYSIVRFELNAQGSDTKLTLDHTAFPDGAAEHLDGGWHKMYWEPLKKYLA
jgi:activator of HSP90 ATPase